MSDRRLFGWDLPPGVRVSDIPGNRPVDAYVEIKMDEIFDVLVKALSPQLDDAEDFVHDLFEIEQVQYDLTDLLTEQYYAGDDHDE